MSRSGLPGGGIDRLRAAIEVRVGSDDGAPSPASLIELAAEAQVLVCVNGDPLGEELLDRCPELRLLAVVSAGYDTVDVAAALGHGVAVTHTPGVLHETTADLAFGLILAARRRIAEGDRFVRAGRWVSKADGIPFGDDVHGTQLGIVGYGEIGHAVARRATGFGMMVVHHSRTIRSDDLSRWMPLGELLRSSDIVSLHVPLTDETRGLIGEAELRSMKPTATLVNTARGAVVDEAALVRALDAGWIGSAGLDVQVVEPNADPDHPLLRARNCVLLPHIGSATLATRAAMVDLAVDNVLAYLAGRPLLTPIPESRSLQGVGNRHGERRDARAYPDARASDAAR